MAYATRGSGDVAYLYDSPGKDTLVATPSTPGSRETSWPLLDPPPPHAAAIPASAILPQSRRFTARPEQQ